MSDIEQEVKKSLQTFDNTFKEDQAFQIQTAQRIIKLLDKNDQLLDEFFNQFYQLIASDHQYNSIVNFVQSLWRISSLRAGKQQNIITNWIWYQLKRVNSKIRIQGLQIVIADKISIRCSLQQIINAVCNICELILAEKNGLKANISKSPIKQDVTKYLMIKISDNLVNSKKINEKHAELLQLMNFMKSYRGVIECQLQSHILIEFEAKYQLNSQIGEEAKEMAISIQDLMKEIKAQKRYTRKIQQKFRELQGCTPEKRYSMLVGIKSELVCVDTFCLKRLIDLPKKRLNQQNEDKHKHLLLFLGSTGSGKTTMISRILGYKLKEGRINGLKTLIPENLRPQHIVLQTSAESTSTTRYISAFMIPKESLQLASKQKIYVCDSPGFQDTEGVQIDVSNSISIKNALQNCQSVRLIVVISSRKVGDKMEGIKQLGKIVSNMIVTYENMKVHISFVLNKFDCEEEQKRLASGVRSILQNISQKDNNNPGYIEFLKHLHEDLLEHKYQKFHPQNTDIVKFVEKIKRPRFTSGSQHFNVSFSKNSDLMLKNRKIILKKIINQNLGINNSFALYYLQEFIALCQSINGNPNQISEEKNKIKLKYGEKIERYKKKIDEQKSIESFSSNSVQQIQLLVQQIKSYQIFQKCIQNFVQKDSTTVKKNQAKAQILASIQKMSFQPAQTSKTKTQIYVYFHFFIKFNNNDATEPFKVLARLYYNKKSEFNELIKKKDLKQIKEKLNGFSVILESMLQEFDKVQSIKNIKILQKMVSRQQQLRQLQKSLIKSFQVLIKEICSQICQRREVFQQIKDVTINRLKEINQLFKVLGQQGVILKDIRASHFEQMLSQKIAQILRKQIKQSKQILDKATNSILDHHKANIIRINKANMSKITKSFKQIILLIGQQNADFWQGIIKFIQSSTSQLLKMISDIKQGKGVNRKILGSLKPMIHRVLELSKKSNNKFDDLYEDRQKFKSQIREALYTQVNNLEIKARNITFSIKNRNNSKIEQLNKKLECFQEIEAFYNIGQLKEIITYLSDLDDVKEQVHKKQAEVYKDLNYNITNLDKTIKNTYQMMTDKVLNPFHQIYQMLSKYKDQPQPLSKIPLSLLKTLHNFLFYTSYLHEKNIFQSSMKEKIYKTQIEKKNKVILENLIKSTIQQFDNIYNKKDVYIYQLKQDDIKLLKKSITNITYINQSPLIQTLIQQQKFEWGYEYAEKLIQLLKKSEQSLSKLLKGKNAPNQQFIIRIIGIKDQIKQMKNFDQLDLQFFGLQNTKFGQFEQVLQNILKGNQEKTQGKISSLFHQNSLMKPDIVNLYRKLKTNQTFNETELNELIDRLSQHANRLKRDYQTSKEKYLQNFALNQEENSFIVSYLNNLQKLHSFHRWLLTFIEAKHLENIIFDQKYFVYQIQEVNLEKIIDEMKKMLREGINNYEYIDKKNELSKKQSDIMIATTLVRRILNDNGLLRPDEDYNKLNLQKKQNFNKIYYRVSNNSNYEEMLIQQNVNNYYHKIGKQNQKIINDRFIQVMQSKMKKYQQLGDHIESQKIKLQQKIQLLLQNAPIQFKGLFKQKYQKAKKSILQKNKIEFQSIKQNLELSTNQNLTSIIALYMQYKNPHAQKLCLQFLQRQFKFHQQQIFQNYEVKTLKEVLQKYIKIFGNQKQLHSIKDRIYLQQQLKDRIKDKAKRIMQKLISLLKQRTTRLNQISSQVQSPNFKLFQQLFQDQCKFYALLIESNNAWLVASEHKQAIQLWKTYLGKLNQRLLGAQLQCESFYIIQNSSKAKSNQKKLVQLKFFGIFKDIFLKNMQNLYEDKRLNQFLSKYYEVLRQQDIDIKIKQSMKKQLNKVISTLQNGQFYDEYLKNYNTENLKLQIQRLFLKNMKIIAMYQKIYNTYLVDSYSVPIKIDSLQIRIQKKWEITVEQAKMQYKKSTSNKDLQIGEKLFALYRLSEIIWKQQWIIIDKDLKSKQNIEHFLYDEQQQTKAIFQRHKQSIGNVCDQIMNYKNQVLQISNMKQGSIIDQSPTKSESETENSDLSLSSLSLSEKDKQSIATQIFQKHNEELIILQRKKKKQQEIIAKKNQYNQKIKQLQQKLQGYIQKNLINDLINLKKVICSIGYKMSDYQNLLDTFLNQINKIQKSINKIIHTQLLNTQNTYALMITQSSEIFRYKVIQQFKSKTQKQDIHYILNKSPQLQKDSQLKNDILLFYDIYKEEYDKNIQKFKNNPEESQITSIQQNLILYKLKNDLNEYIGIHPAAIVGQIFSLWSMIKSDYSNKDNVMINYTPHPAQIVAIALLLGNEIKRFRNKLVQILTGEGKSIVLAGLCCYLALNGYSPYCACYSEYLSERDGQQFKDLFERLKITDRIRYGTINKHCEDIINDISKENYSKQLREYIKQIILNKQPRNVNNTTASKIFDHDFHKKSKKILIIDEADVFFDQKYFGRQYNLSISLNDSQIVKLIQMVWSITSESRQNGSINKILPPQIYQSKEFLRLLNKYPNLKKVLENQVIGMLEGAYEYDHSYVIHQQSIMYRSSDSITNKISYGYKTVFANCYEYQRKSISQRSYMGALKITLCAAPFSYSELPTFFQAILGVSGTIKSIPSNKKQILKEKYKIQTTYELPSIFGENKRQKDQFHIVADEKYYDQIIEHTEEMIVSKRPVVIYFKNKHAIIDFYNSPAFKQLTKYSTILDEETDHQLRSTIINRAGQREKITILTSTFTRGVDFKIYEKSLNSFGGLHVMQTYVPQNQSQFIQTKGRTARQGERGSYQMIISESEQKNLQQQTSYVSGSLIDKVQAFWKKNSENQSFKEKIKQSKKKHEVTQRIFNDILTQQKLLNFLWKLNEFKETQKINVQTLIGVDGTGSMAPVLNIVRQILDDSFIRTENILKQRNVSGSFQNQVAIYRNYNSKCDQILEYSGFESSSQRLKQFMSKLQPKGGQGNQAMQVLLQHGNKIPNLNQIIVIADARSNTCQQTKTNRGRYGEQYWTSNGFPLTNEFEEIIKLGSKNVKVHTLYINISTNPQRRNELEEYCNEISSFTKGVSHQFKIKLPNASIFLAEFLVKSILYQIGGKQKGDELAQSYDNNYESTELRL